MVLIYWLKLVVLIWKIGGWNAYCGFCLFEKLPTNDLETHSRGSCRSEKTPSVWQINDGDSKWLPLPNFWCSLKLKQIKFFLSFSYGKTSKFILHVCRISGTKYDRFLIIFLLLWQKVLFKMKLKSVDDLSLIASAPN